MHILILEDEPVIAARLERYLRDILADELNADIHLLCLLWVKSGHTNDWALT